MFENDFEEETREIGLSPPVLKLERFENDSVEPDE
jgi:hypothetical protein